jgi:predicted nucleic acid-binding protein
VKFWDSSAIVPLVIQQALSKFSLKLLKSDPVQLVSFTTYCEVYSALSRLEREGFLPADRFATSEQQLNRLAKAWHVVTFSAAVESETKRLLRIHSIKCADAFQLASAINCCDRDFEAFSFVTFDQKLGITATREGFRVESG